VGDPRLPCQQPPQLLARSRWLAAGCRGVVGAHMVCRAAGAGACWPAGGGAVVQAPSNWQAAGVAGGGGGAHRVVAALLAAAGQQRLQAAGCLRLARVLAQHLHQPTGPGRGGVGWGEGWGAGAGGARIEACMQTDTHCMQLQVSVSRQLRIVVESPDSVTCRSSRSTGVLVYRIRLFPVLCQRAMCLRS